MRLTDFLDKNPGSDADFARRIGITPQALSRYRKGLRRPEWNVLERIQQETGGTVTPNDFLEGPVAIDAQEPERLAS